MSVEPGCWSIASLGGLDFGYTIGKHVLIETAKLPEWDTAYERSSEEFEIAIRATLAVGPAPMTGDPVTDLEQSHPSRWLWILAHVAKRGDIIADELGWAGVRQSGLAVEGFAIRPISEPLYQEIRYRALLADRSWSEWVFPGDFCGSRGQGRPLLGYEAQLQGEARWQLDLWCSARFIDGTEINPVVETFGNADGFCFTSQGAPLEAMQISISERSKRSMYMGCNDPSRAPPEVTLTAMKRARGEPVPDCVEHYWIAGATTYFICLRCGKLKKAMPDFSDYGYD